MQVKPYLGTLYSEIIYFCSLMKHWLLSFNLIRGKLFIKNGRKFIVQLKNKCYVRNRGYKYIVLTAACNVRQYVFTVQYFILVRSVHKYICFFCTS
jgi:hypothetical protein